MANRAIESQARAYEVMIEASSVDRDQSSRFLALEQRPFGFIFALALCPRPPVNCWLSAADVLFQTERQSPIWVDLF